MPQQSTTYSARKEAYHPTPYAVLQVHFGTVLFDPKTARATCNEHRRTMIYNEQMGWLSCPQCATIAAIKLLTEVE